MTEYFADYQMDTLRALEMSRLQFLQEMDSLRPGTGERQFILINIFSKNHLLFITFDASRALCWFFSFLYFKSLLSSA